jgi:hypothetical protein
MVALEGLDESRQSCFVVATSMPPVPSPDLLRADTGAPTFRLAPTVGVGREIGELRGADKWTRCSLLLCRRVHLSRGPGRRGFTVLSRLAAVVEVGLSARPT